VKLYSVAEVAEIVGVSEKSVRGAIRREALPASKICGRIRITKRDLKEWIELNRVATREKHQHGVRPLARSPRRATGAFAAALGRAAGERRATG
jgi:excisionase family DNA binding protein